MNRLELKNKQRKKLIEMINILFPEYNRFVGFYKTEDELFYEEKIYKFSMLHLIGDDDIQIIHWFEFCMINLSNSIFKYWDNINKENIEIQRNEFYYSIYNDKQNLVDYLYEQFKKLEELYYLNI